MNHFTCDEENAKRDAHVAHLDVGWSQKLHWRTRRSLRPARRGRGPIATVIEAAVPSVASALATHDVLDRKQSPPQVGDRIALRPARRSLLTARAE